MREAIARAAALVSCGVALLSLVVWAMGCSRAGRPHAGRGSLATEPLLPPPPTVPSGNPRTPEAYASAALASLPTGTAASSPLAVAPTPRASQGGLYSERQRLGAGVSGLPLDAAGADRLGVGWYLNWRADPAAFRSADVEYVPMIRLHEGKPDLDDAALVAAVRALPGALWLIGNEPDVKWQDNVLPEVYAQAYHDLCLRLKALDPTCHVAIGGVSQPTPLRLRYLDRILESYRARYGAPMPVDVWNVHNFILREERDSWGVDIPAGMAEQTGVVREIVDHDDLSIFEEQIVAFRRWMKQRGQQDKALIVTEFGILMPNDYGFPPERVEQFLKDTFRFFDAAADPALGLPEDGYRLVQRWCWFSLADTRYPTGNLLSPEGAPTPLGEAFSRYAHFIP